MVAGQRRRAELDFVAIKVRFGLTVVVSLVGVGNQPAVVWSRRHHVRDAVAVVVVVTLVAQPVFVGVHLGAVDHQRAIVLGILVTIAIATGRQWKRCTQKL